MNQNDIQRGLDYENISYTKEQNEKLLNEIGTAQMNQQSARLFPIEEI